MTLADQTRSGQVEKDALECPPSIPHCRQHYRVDLRNPASHLLKIELRIQEVDRRLPLRVKMPVWTPGSYLVREYARHLQDLQVRDQDGSAICWRKENKNTWDLQADPTAVDLATVILSYRLYAYELTVRTNHMDLSHAYFNGAATFLYVVGRVHEPLSLTIALPDPSWQIATSLSRIKTQVDRQEATFTAATYDELVDSPVEAGLQRSVHFQVLDKPHQWTVWGEGNLNLEQTVHDTRRIIETTAHLFGNDLPYSRYLFLLHLSAAGFGGLEHRCSTTLNFSRFEFHHPERYQRFLALVAHEFFHTWNIKRLRPRALEIPDYDQETYLSCLWFVEGATSYYENLMLLRAGLIPASRCLEVFGRN
ncbi:MAG: M61 family metallopeptidase [Synechococcaceae cyanobacterium SM2_3_1]|nr:M61 family metallopeptidase [Synechococcaceae cyanobacterium SM2_3_1]